MDTSRTFFPDLANSNKGVTQRQWYAGLAMQAILSNPVTALDQFGAVPPSTFAENVSKLAHIVADAMLQEDESP